MTVAVPPPEVGAGVWMEGGLLELSPGTGFPLSWNLEHSYESFHKQR